MLQKAPAKDESRRPKNGCKQPDKCVRLFLCAPIHKIDKNMT